MLETLPGSGHVSTNCHLGVGNGGRRMLLVDTGSLAYAD